MPLRKKQLSLLAAVLAAPPRTFGGEASSAFRLSYFGSAYMPTAPSRVLCLPTEVTVHA